MREYFDRRYDAEKLGKRRKGKSKDLKIEGQKNPQQLLEQDLQAFRARLEALEKEQNLFSLGQQWQNKSHLARTYQLVRELRTLEKRLRHFSSANTATRFLIDNTLLRFQSFKTMYRRFWGAISEIIS